MFRVSLLIAVLAIGVVGCGGNRDATVYRVPKENPGATPTSAPSPAASMAQQTLPEELVNASGNPAWAIPAHWINKAGSAMRRASFTLPGAGSEVDISVTSFPGDVGGKLANVNRWRNQLSLPALSAAALEAEIVAVETASGPGEFVSIDNGTLATLAVTLPHAGNSWFFKMTGPRELVAAEREVFLAFVRSTDFGAAEPS